MNVSGRIVDNSLNENVRSDCGCAYFMVPLLAFQGGISQPRSRKRQIRTTLMAVEAKNLPLRVVSNFLASGLEVHWAYLPQRIMRTYFRSAGSGSLFKEL